MEDWITLSLIDDKIHKLNQQRHKLIRDRNFYLKHKFIARLCHFDLEFNLNRCEELLKEIESLNENKMIVCGLKTTKNIF